MYCLKSRILSEFPILVRSGRESIPAQVQDAD
jgi:hypothetical protein